jgi:hypothetical protein
LSDLHFGASQVNADCPPRFRHVFISPGLLLGVSAAQGIFHLSLVGIRLVHDMVWLEADASQGAGRKCTSMFRVSALQALHIAESSPELLSFSAGDGFVDTHPV